MEIKDIMTKKPCFIAPETTLIEAAALMEKHHCGALFVGKPNKLQGVVTDRDITIKAIANGLTPENTLVKKIMTTHIESCFEQDSLRDAIKKMEKGRVLRLVVFNREKEVVGVVSHGDIAKAVLRNETERSHVSEDLIKAAGVHASDTNF